MFLFPSRISLIFVSNLKVRSSGTNGQNNDEVLPDRESLNKKFISAGSNGSSSFSGTIFQQFNQYRNKSRRVTLEVHTVNFPTIDSGLKPVRLAPLLHGTFRPMHDSSFADDQNDNVVFLVCQVPGRFLSAKFYGIFFFRHIKLGAYFIMNSCTIPTPVKDLDGDDRWLSIHRRFLSECREKDPDVIFLGDCVLESLQHTETWNLYFAPMHCLNFSIRNDRTQNVLWRVENGELDNVRPKVVVLHVGTNNIENTAEEVAEGIHTIVSRIREKLPDAYIVLPTILPRGQQPNSLRDKNTDVNNIMREKCIGFNRVQIVSIDKGLIQSDGTISHHDMFDYLNLTNSGSKKIFEPVHDLLSQILNENEPEKDLTPSE